MQATLDEMADSVGSAGLETADPSQPADEADIFIGTLRTVLVRQIIGTKEELSDRFFQTLPDCPRAALCPRRIALLALQSENPRTF